MLPLATAVSISVVYVFDGVLGTRVSPVKTAEPIVNCYGGRLVSAPGPYIRWVQIQHYGRCRHTPRENKGDA